jgi:hypothetical protein
MEGPLFRVALWRRLRLRVQEKDIWCSFCAQVLDSFGDHALVCACKGDRTVRHSRLRNLVFEEATEAGMGVETEKASLFPGRPAEDGLCTEGEARRPADTVEGWEEGEERGLGICGHIRNEGGQIGDRGEEKKGTAAIIQKYEEFKNKYKDTWQQCDEQGIDFVPMIIEAHGGGMSCSMRSRLHEIARRQKSAGTDCEGIGPGLLIAQRSSLCRQEENARAIWRRLPQEVDVEGEGGVDDDAGERREREEGNRGSEDAAGSQEVDW